MYQALRTELEGIVGRVTTVRGWTVLLVGASMTAGLTVLTGKPPPSGALIRDSVTISVAITAAAGLVNLALWMITLGLVRHIFRIGAFLWWIEEQTGHHDGWEHWVLLDRWRLRNRGFWLEDVNAWVAILYQCLITAIAILTRNKLAIVLALFLLVLSTLLARYKASVESRRRVAMKELSEWIKRPSEWYGVIEKELGINLPRVESRV